MIDEHDQEAREDARDLHISIMVRGAVREAVSKAMDEAIAKHMPTEEERAYLSLAVRRAARNEKLQQAIIEKSLGALVLAGILFIGAVFYDYIVDHGWRP